MPGGVWSGPSAQSPAEAGQDLADAEFIAHARTDVPRLLATIRTQRAALEQYADERNWIGHERYPENHLIWYGNDADGWAVARAALAGPEKKG